MRKMTESNLLAAFAGESQAHMKYNIFADRAERERRPNLARLFRAIAFAERVHATNHLRELGLIKGSAENLQVAADGESFEINEMYPAYHNVAELQEERGAIRSTTYALEAEKDHLALYQEAQKAVAQNQDVSAGELWVCDVCGHTVVGDAPDVCPICKAKRDAYKKF